MEMLGRSHAWVAGCMMQETEQQHQQPGQPPKQAQEQQQQHGQLGLQLGPQRGPGSVEGQRGVLPQGPGDVWVACLNLIFEWQSETTMGRRWGPPVAIQLAYEVPGTSSTQTVNMDEWRAGLSAGLIKELSEWSRHPAEQLVFKVRAVPIQIGGLGLAWSLTELRLSPLRLSLLCSGMTAPGAPLQPWSRVCLLSASHSAVYEFQLPLAPSRE